MKIPLIRLLLLATLGPVAGLQAQSNYATPYTFTTLAGDATGGAGYADGTGGEARFISPAGVATDGSGNIYVADVYNHTIRMITPAGVVTTLVGTPGSAGSADGTGAAAQFNQPSGVAVDGSGNVYVADTTNHTIRKVTPEGVVTTFAGSPGNSGSADGVGAAARFKYPVGVAVDGAGNVYVADTSNNLIRKITTAGAVSTIGNAATGIALPWGVAVSGAGDVYVANTDDHTIRKISAGGVVTTVAGSHGVPGFADGPSDVARFTNPTGVAVDGAGNLYVADSSNSIVRKIASDGTVTTLAGMAHHEGDVDGIGSAARFTHPTGIAIDGTGQAYIADSFTHIIRKLTVVTAEVSTFAGKPGPQGYSDGAPRTARFDAPAGIAVDPSGNVYVADTYNNTIRKISADGSVTTLAGTAKAAGSADGTGNAAQFLLPFGIAVDAAGTLYVADTWNGTIRKITTGGIVTTLAGTAGNLGYADGTGSAAQFKNPYGVAVDGVGNVYVGDTGNHIIRKITSAGVVTTLAGTPGVFGSSDGIGTTAKFDSPQGVAVDGSGNVYVADSFNDTIRKITSDGIVTTVAGRAHNFGSADGIGSAAQFDYPTSVAVDGAGIVYVANAYTIRKITGAGVVTTLGGTPGSQGLTDGTAGAARFALFTGSMFPTTVLPQGIAADFAGTVYVADTGNDTIRKGTLTLRVPHDLNSDGKADILWRNTVTGQFCVWLMDGTTYLNWVDFGRQSTDWHVAVTGAFNADGKTDIMWENLVTGERGFWLMNGPTFASWVDIGVIPTAWRVAAAADLNGDGKTDLIWENTVTGERYFWYMNGTTVTGAALLATVSTDWHIAAAADFNADGKPDLLWENAVTGDHYYWFMNNTAVTGALFMGNFGTEWHLAAVADYNGDGKPDLLWENRTTGDRYLWFMNGTDITSAILVSNVSTDWQIVH